MFTSFIQMRWPYILKSIMLWPLHHMIALCKHIFFARAIPALSIGLIEQYSAGLQQPQQNNHTNNIDAVGLYQTNTK